MRKGMELVLRDERWHIGFGSRVIQSADVVDDEMEALLTQGTRAAAAWGDLIARDAIAQVERHLIVRVLRHTKGSQVQAARILGMTRATLRGKIRALRISIDTSVWSTDDQPG